MTYYENQKKTLRELIWKFELTDNLIILALLVNFGRDILKDQKCEELLVKLGRKTPPKGL